MKFSAWAIFVPVWTILVYCPVEYWMYRGWMAEWGVLDFAGGTTIIHINAGVAAGSDPGTREAQRLPEAPMNKRRWPR